jgi:hypothetical protein
LYGGVEFHSPLSYTLGALESALFTITMLNEAMAV